MARRQLWWAALLAFPLTYCVLYEALNWFSVYVLDWWDPKFGDRRGSIAFGHQLLPVFLSVAVVSHAVGFAVCWRRARELSPARLALAGIVAAALAETAAFLFSLATRGRGANPGMTLTLIGPALLFLGPGAFTAVTLSMTTRHPSGRARDAV
jgi:hypothetical protein